MSTEGILTAYEKQRLEYERDWYRWGMWAVITIVLCMLSGCAGSWHGETATMNDALKYGHARTVQYNALVGGRTEVRERIEWNHKCASEAGK